MNVVLSYLEPEPKVNEKITIDTDDIDTLYQKCLDWLKSINAKIEEKKPSYYLKARHIGGVIDKGRGRNGRMFQIFLTPESTSLSSVSPSTHVTVNLQIHRRPHVRAQAEH